MEVRECSLYTSQIPFKVSSLKRKHDFYWTMKQWRKNLGGPCYRNVKLSNKYPKENWNGKSKLKKLYENFILDNYILEYVI